jgi:tetratricopeptide (TPR) repeat protein
MNPKKISAAMLAGSFVAIVPCFSQSTSNTQQQIEAHSRQAQKFLKENKPELAVPEFKALVTLEPNNVDARGNLGVLLFFEGAYTEAIPQLHAALKLQPTLWKIEALLGMAEKRTGSANAALGDLEKAFPKLTEEKIRVDTGLELIELYSKSGDLEKAAATVGVLRQLAPTNVQVIFAAYRLYSDLADESKLSLSVVAPKSAEVHQMMAHELAREGKSDEAIANYRAALAIDPKLPGLLFELAEMLNSSEVKDGAQEAEREYHAALEANPLDEKSECRLGEIAALRGDVKDAQNHYVRALQLQPDDPEANIGLAKVWMSMNQPEKAEPLLKHAIELDPTSALAHFRLATVYRQTERSDDARRELVEYQKYKDMKEKLREMYRAMRLNPGKQEPDDAETQNP